MVLLATISLFSNEKEPISGFFFAINEEALCEWYRLTKQHELETISQQLEIVEAELGKRSLANVPTPKLYGILFKLMDEVRERRAPFVLQHTHAALDFEDIATKSSWGA